MIEPKDKRTKEYKEWKASEGLGDTIEKVLNHPIVKPVTNLLKKIIFKDGEDCDCPARKKKLNKEFRYKLKPRCFTEQEYKEWGKFKTKVELPITNQKDINYICDTYYKIMNTQYFKPVANSQKPLIHMIDKLNIVYDSY